MNKLFLFLLSLSFLSGYAQKSKSATIDLNKSPETKAKIEKTFPRPVKPANMNTTKKDSIDEAKKKEKEAFANPKAKPFGFLGSFTMNFDDKNVQGKSNAGKIKYALDGFKASITPSFTTVKEITSMFSIVDLKENDITVLTTDSRNKKTGLILSIPKPVITKPADPKAVVKPPVIKKTGETKVIQGYKCERIIVTYSNGDNADAWVTSEIPLVMTDLLNLINAGFKGKSPFGKTNVSDIKGTALETVLTYKDGAVMKITVTDIKKVKPDAAVFSTTGYKVMDARGLPMFGGQ